MAEEPSIRTKMDVLDLIIGFLIEHEKQMDQMVQQFERVMEAQSRRKATVHVPETLHPAETRPNSITLTINVPKMGDHIKSIKIDWESGQPEIIQASLERKMRIRSDTRTIVRN